MSAKVTKFERALEIRRQQVRARTGHDPCTCWECIRKDGLTPPYSLRRKHPTGDKPPKVMNGTIDPQVTGDPGGWPMAWKHHGPATTSESDA